MDLRHWIIIMFFVVRSLSGVAFAEEKPWYIRPGDPETPPNFIDSRKSAISPPAVKLWWDKENYVYRRQIIFYNDSPREITKEMYIYVMGLKPDKCCLQNYGYDNKWPRSADIDFSKFK